VQHDATVAEFQFATAIGRFSVRFGLAVSLQDPDEDYQAVRHPWLGLGSVGGGIEWGMRRMGWEGKRA